MGWGLTVGVERAGQGRAMGKKQDNCNCTIKNKIKFTNYKKRKENRAPIFFTVMSNLIMVQNQGLFILRVASM